MQATIAKISGGWSEVWHVARPADEVSFGEELLLREASLASVDYRHVLKSPNLYFDFSRCRHFDIVALLHVIAATSFRKEMGHATHFRLPSDRHARHTLRQWAFPKVVSSVAGVPFRLLVDPDSQEYFGEVTPSSSDLVYRTAPESIHYYLEDRQFFGLTSYVLNDSVDRWSLVEEQWRRWRSPLVRQLLGARLADGDPLDVPRVVVQELLTTLLARASGGRVVFASQMQAPSSVDARPYLSLAAWHNAENVDEADLTDAFWASVDHRMAGSAEYELEMEESSPNVSSTWERLLIAFRRARLRLSGRVEERAPSPGTSEEVNDLRASSMDGLCRYVVGAYGGTVHLWSCGWFMRVAQNQSGRTPYSVTMRRSPYIGNILAVRLPLNDE